MAPLCRALALCLTAFAGACASLPGDRPAVTTSGRGSPARNERLAPSAPVDPGASPDVTSPTSVVEPASASPCSASGVEPRPRALALPHRLAGEATPVAPFEQLDAEALEMERERPGMKVSRTDAVQVLLHEALAAREAARKGKPKK